MIKIAIISDIHYGRLSRTKEFSVPGEPLQDQTMREEPLRESLISVMREAGVRYLFVAGDLTSTGSPQEFYYCEEELLSIAEKAGIPRKNILCSMGNHDIDWEISKIGDSYKNDYEDVAKLVKEKYQSIAAHSSLVKFNKIEKLGEAGPVPFSGIMKNRDIIVYQLNSGWCCTHDQKYSHGKLTTEQLKWFEKYAEKYKGDTRIKIVLMHHHPFKYTYPVPCQDISMVEEGSEIMDIAGKNGIDIIIHGHRHHPMAKTIQVRSGTKPITLICAGSLSVNASQRNGGNIPNTMHILEIDKKESSFLLYNYEYKLSRGWELIKNYSEEAPLDPKMKLGKMFLPQQINEAIMKYSSEEQVELSWNNLEECLKFMFYDELNEKFKEKLSSTHKIAGRFPEDVILIRKGKKK